VETQHARSRQSRRSAIQRAGADLVLLAVAGLALWQLTRYGSPLLVDATGRLGIDPLLVAGPALALLAGSVLALRLIPALSGRAEFIGARHPGLAPALGAWQVGRRPQRYAGPALLLVMALSIGALSVTYAATWRRSQDDQADFRAGADLRVEAPVGPRALPQLGRAAAYAGLPGVTTAMPVYRDDIDVSTQDTDLVALDAARAGEVVTFRPDLADRSWPQLLEPLAAGRADSSGVPIPAEPDRLTVLARADTVRGRVERVELALVLKDTTGLLHRRELGSLPTDNRRHARLVDVAEAAGPGAVLAYPLTLVAVEAVYVLPTSSRSNGGDTLTLTVDAIKTSDDGTLSSPDVVATRSSTNGRQDESPMVARSPTTDEESFLDLQIDTGSTITFDRRTDVTVVAEFAPQSGSQPLPALLDRAAAGTAGLGVGDDLAVQVGGESYNLSVQGVVDGLPTVTPGRGAVVVDLPSLAAKHYTTTGELLEAEEWWLDVDGDPLSTTPDTAAVAAALRQRPDLGGDIVDRLALRRELQTDPLGLAVVGALALGFLAAAAFAAVGFAVNAIVSARERLGELALLRALGVAPRQLFGLLAVEQAFLVGLGCLAGVALGVLIARLVVPLVSLTAQATRAEPPVLVDVPWPAVLGLAAALALVLAVVVLILGVGVRRLAVARTLRLGEDR
ncbi:MAG: ABC transporter permease, partial [Acidothermales bacterium]|nr:ABC transporter permease [Acidothermales bacterium]